MLSKFTAVFVALAALSSLQGIYAAPNRDPQCNAGTHPYCCGGSLSGNGGLGVNCSPYDDSCDGEILCCASSERGLAFGCTAPK